MGVALGRLWQRVMGLRAFRVLMLGLDYSGKTTLLYRLSLGETVPTIPTIGFNVETLKHGASSIVMWDLGYQEKLVPLWRHYYQGATGLIFVIDSSDSDRLPEAKAVLQKLLRDDELRRLPLLVLANKQDLPNSLAHAQVATELALQSLVDRPWYVQDSCGCTGAGLEEGLSWLVQLMVWSPIAR